MEKKNLITSPPIQSTKGIFEEKEGRKGGEGGGERKNLLDPQKRDTVFSCGLKGEGALRRKEQKKKKKKKIRERKME